MTKRKGNNKQKRKTQRPRPLVDAAAPIRHPFASSGFKWPDERTSQSTCISSRYRTTLVPTHETGTNTSHSVGVIITPNPETGLVTLNMPGSSINLSDTVTVGTAYWSQITAPNLSTIKASPGLIRCTGIGARITYGGTNLQQSGRMAAGIGKHIYTPGVRATTGTKLSYLSTMTSGRNTELAPIDIMENLTNLSTARNPDGVFECHWRPTKVPEYMAVNNASVVYTTAAGVSPADNTYTPLNQVPAQQGVEAGQSSLVVVVDGDTTAAASATGNPYFLDVVWHWEYIPMDPLKTVVDIGPSPYDPAMLARIINSLELGPTSYIRSATSDTSSSYFADSYSYEFPGAQQVYSAARKGGNAAVNAFAQLQRLGFFRPAAGQRAQRQLLLQN